MDVFRVLRKEMLYLGIGLCAWEILRESEDKEVENRKLGQPLCYLLGMLISCDIEVFGRRLQKLHF